MIFDFEGVVMFYLQRSLNLHSFGTYTFAYYKSLGIRNDFEKNYLPSYLKRIMEDKRTLYDFFFGKSYFTYEADPRIIIGKVIDTVERKSFIPALFNYDNRRFYEEAAPLTLLAIFSESYRFADIDEPIAKDDMELFTTLLKKCKMSKFEELSESFCLRDSRKKLEKEIWNSLNLLY